MTVPGPTCPERRPRSMLGPRDRVPTAEPRPGRLATTIAFAVLLLAYGNGDAWVAMRRPRPLTAPVNLRHLSILLLSLVWARAEGLPGRELGVSRRGAGRSLGWGIALGVFASIPIRLFFMLPLAVNRAVTQPQLPVLSRRRLLMLLAGQFLLSTAVFEEVAFRGVLHAKLVRLFGVRRALLVGSGLFAAWHAVIAWHNVRQADLPRRMRPALYAAALATLFLAGLLFGALRHTTGHLAGGIIAHWAMVSTIVLALARTREGRE